MTAYTRNTSDGRYEFFCKECGASYIPALPISIGMMVSLMEQFGKEHEHCEPERTTVPLSTDDRTPQE